MAEAKFNSDDERGVEDDEQCGLSSAVPPVFKSETRTVVCGDAIDWLNSFDDNGLPEGYCGFTSLPDISELIRTFKTDTAEYKKWFIDAAALFMSKLRVGSFVVFLQSDVRYLSPSGDVGEWIDKSYLCSAAAERTGCVLMWHKLVSTDKTANKKATGRPTYSHLICYGKNGYVDHPVEEKVSRNKRRKEIRAENMRMKAEREAAQGKVEAQTATAGQAGIADCVPALSEQLELTAIDKTDNTTTTLHLTEPTSSAEPSSTTCASPSPPPAVPVASRYFWRCGYRTSLFAVPDIFYRGEMLWPKGIGLDCCFVGVMFLKSVVGAKGIIDPFAGQGTVLAMADAVGLPSIGVEISAKRCRKAHNLKIQLDLVSPQLRKLALDVVGVRANGGGGGGDVEKRGTIAVEGEINLTSERKDRTVVTASDTKDSATDCSAPQT